MFRGQRARLRLRCPGRSHSRSRACSQPLTPRSMRSSGCSSTCRCSTPRAATYRTNRLPPTGDCSPRRPRNCADPSPRRRVRRESPARSSSSSAAFLTVTGLLGRANTPRRRRMAAQGGRTLRSVIAREALETADTPLELALRFQQLQRQRRAADIHAQIVNQPADDAQALVARWPESATRRGEFRAAQRHRARRAPSPRRDQACTAGRSRSRQSSHFRRAHEPRADESPVPCITSTGWRVDRNRALLRISSYNAFACGLYSRAAAPPSVARTDPRRVCPGRPRPRSRSF